MKTINDLPSELMVKIFSEYIRTEGPREFLKNIPLVCARWKDLSTVSSLWKKISFRSMDWNFDSLLKLGERGLFCKTRSLNLCTWKIGFVEDYNNSDKCLHVEPKLLPEDTIKLVPHYHNLEALDITKNMISRPMLELLTIKWPNINRLVMVCVTDSDATYDPNFPPRSSMTLQPSTLDPVFINWGQKLKHLDLNRCHFTYNDDPISKVADFCPFLEEFHFCHVRYGDQRQFQIEKKKFRCPIDKLQIRCPKLRVLRLGDCEFTVEDAANLPGFAEMRNFASPDCIFHDLELIQILKNSTELESLEIDQKLRTLHKIPSVKMKELLVCYDKDSVTYVKQAIMKWKYTLRELSSVIDDPTDVPPPSTDVLVNFLKNNHDPPLKYLFLGLGPVQVPVLKEVVQGCQKLDKLFFRLDENNLYSCFYFQNRQSVEIVLQLP